MRATAGLQVDLTNKGVTKAVGHFYGNKLTLVVASIFVSVADR